MQDIDVVAAELFRDDVERVLARLDEAALHAIRDVGELNPAVADGAAAERMQPSGDRANLVGHLDGISDEEAGVAVAVGDDADVRRNLGVALDQPADGGGKAGSKAAC